MGSSIRDNRTISRQSNGCDFFPNDFRRDKRETPIWPVWFVRLHILAVLPFVSMKYIVTYTGITLNKAQQLVLPGRALALDKPISLLLNKCIG